MKDNIFTEIIPKGQGCLCVLGSGGDTKIFWNEKNKEEVNNAKMTFEKLVNENKFAAFSVDESGEKSKKVTEFKPDLQKLILVPPMAGGAMPRIPSVGSIVQCEFSEKKEQHISEEAEIKAVNLFRQKIGEEKFIKFVAVGYIELKGKYGKYIIRTEDVKLHRTDKIGQKTRPLFYNLCISTDKTKGNLPWADKLLALYLNILNKENEFIKTANFRNVYTNDEFHERGEYREV